MTTFQIAAFASGRGSNFQAIVHHLHEQPDSGIRVNALFSDNAKAGALDFAKAAGIPVFYISYEQGKSHAEQEILSYLSKDPPDLLVLCGFMRLLSAHFISHFPNRIVNIHPSLLPAFPGLHAQRQALDYGVKVSGCTVHYVDSGMDTGKIIAQATVPVFETDTEASLSARILAEEHQLLSRVILDIKQEKQTRQGG